MAIELAQLHPQEIWFPPLEEALDEPNGLLAFGGDLRPERILAAYRRGIFPWYQDGQPILWWSPDPRAVLYPDQIKISRSMRKLRRSDAFSIAMDSDFEAIIDACAAPTEKRTGTWITQPMRRAYVELHRLGHAHSIEVRQHGRLVGGLYGLGIGRIFFGESMFSRVDNASKLALIHLCSQLQSWGFAVVDCQVSSDHLSSMGACEIQRDEFQRLLALHTAQPCAANGHSWRSI
ncbi:MAG TPA: leucyl/phenylalanyl-tRNA--protein transferase [Spongiibacteraceae bacterium]|nr:leucyl/phenylalanyl-tRNA--protein transferase [Spongiibacteraceae bacterium]